MNVFQDEFQIVVDDVCLRVGHTSKLDRDCEEPTTQLPNASSIALSALVDNSQLTKNNNNNNDFKNKNEFFL